MTSNNAAAQQVRIAIENSAGQGTSIGRKFEEIADLIEKGQEDALATVLEEAQSRRLSLPDQTS